MKKSQKKPARKIAKLETKSSVKKAKPGSERAALKHTPPNAKAKQAKPPLALPKPDASDPGPIPAFLDRSNPKVAKAVEKAKAQTKPVLPSVAVKAMAKAPAIAQAKPQTAAERLKAMLHRETARNAPALASAPKAAVPAKGKVVAFERQRAPVLVAKVGAKARVMGLDLPDVLSRETFTLRALDKGEKTPPGGPWWPIDERRVVHEEDLVIVG